MCQHSRIVVWYQVAGQKVVLGELLSEFGHDVSSIWLSVPEEENHTNSLGYRLSLFDDGGREIASKAVSTQTADEFLARIKVRV
ncbi:30S ribosomal protein S6 modification protein [Vibrio sp. OCN044]|uniref:30S ribosomal protein S6 modification protein n=1 Tax=Vibrio tetraodonis subsp. pristinus TaxID=2695891 RepID=A0A6L8M1W2_9VIBR|nr:30S ribosomal protein S6 modification protein [Vibrio tetraodonis]MYM61486.1 30S ribosomal protein S6 modification protein [Vibrio tetraodonis subsp. pristinus]